MKDGLDYLNCDTSIVQQLKQQNISFSCEQDGVLIENQDEIEFDLELKNTIFNSNLQVKNIKNVKINTLIIEKIILQNIQNQLIQFDSIENLTILNFSITKMDSKQILICIDKINQLLLGKLTLTNNMSLNLYKFSSKKIEIDQIIFNNSQIGSFYILGEELLTINEIFITNFSIQNIKLMQNDPFYASHSKINVQKINIQISNYAAPYAYFQEIFAHFQIVDYSDLKNKIEIKEISFSSFGGQSLKFGAIKFGNNQKTEIIIQKFTYVQYQSLCFMQFQIENALSFQLNELNINGFSEMDNYGKYSLIRFYNVNEFKLLSIITTENHDLEGFIIQGDNSQLFQVDNIQINSLKVKQNLICLQNIVIVSFSNIQIKNAQIFSYLIDVNQIELFSLNRLYVNGIILNKVSLFNLKNLNCVIDQIKFQNINSDLQQVRIFDIQLELYSLNQYDILFQEVNVDLESKSNIQFMQLNGFQYIFKLINSTILNGKSVDFGGCLSFYNTYQQQLYQISMEITNTTLMNCNSKYLGGAISGIKYDVLINSSQFVNCSSQIGGAIYNSFYDKMSLNNELFQDNIGYLADQNFNQLPLYLAISGIYEISTSEFQQTYKFLYPGLTYMIKLSIEIDGFYYDTFSDDSFFGNLYELLIEPSNNYISVTPPQLLQKNFPFLIWYAQDIQFNGNKTIQLQLGNINLINNYILKADKYKIYNGCKEQGMEKIQLANTKSQEFICKYCENMYVSYGGLCEQCQTDYFSTCYGNYSELKPTYWRSEYTVDQQHLYLCSNSPQSCIGGSGIGNQLCYEGHVGPQCLNCDINGDYWEDKYSSIGFFQCVKCKSISSNSVKIIFLLIVLFISLLVIIVSTFRRLKNQIYSVYLSKMGIFFFGQTLLNQSLTSTYIKIFLFHIQVFITQNQFTKLDMLSTFTQFQYLFYNPLASPFFSLNCLISQYRVESKSIGFSDVLLTFIIPFVICLIILIVQIILFLTKKSNLKRCVYTMILSFTYIFLIVFYSILLEKSLSSFFCLKLEENKSYSLIDLSLECGNSSELSKIQNFSLAILIIFLIGFPIIIIIKLIQSRNRLKKIKVMFAYGFLFNEYKTNFFYWEMIRLLVKSLLVLLSLSLKQYPQISLIMISLLLLSYLIALNIQNPFISVFLNNLERISIIISITILLSSNIYISQDLNENQEIENFKSFFYILVQIINLGFIICCLWLIITSFLERQIQKFKRFIKCNCIKNRIKTINNARINKNIQRLIKCVKKIKFSQNNQDETTSLIFSEGDKVN